VVLNAAVVRLTPYPMEPSGAILVRKCGFFKMTNPELETKYPNHDWSYWQLNCPAANYEYLGQAWYESVKHWYDSIQGKITMLLIVSEGAD
jgi:hypothetical protein